MQLSYFVIDETEQLRRVPRQRIEEFWAGHQTAESVGVAMSDQFRLVSVLNTDDDLMPVVCFFVKLELAGGAITRESRINALEAVTNQSRGHYDHPVMQEQFEGWPPNWQHQLAVALDVPPKQLEKVAIGGPLLLSEMWGFPIDQVLAFFEEAKNSHD